MVVSRRVDEEEGYISPVVHGMNGEHSFNRPHGKISFKVTPYDQEQAVREEMALSWKPIAGEVRY